MRQDVTMAFVGTTSGSGGRPTVFVTDRGTLVVQGTTVTDPEAIELMRGRGNGLPAVATPHAELRIR